MPLGQRIAQKRDPHWLRRHELFLGTLRDGASTTSSPDFIWLASLSVCFFVSCLVPDGKSNKRCPARASPAGLRVARRDSTQTVRNRLSRLTAIRAALIPFRSTNIHGNSLQQQQQSRTACPNETVLRGLERIIERNAMRKPKHTKAQASSTSTQPCFVATER